jgi:hypothetical protein
MTSASCKLIEGILDHCEPKVNWHYSFYFTPPVTVFSSSRFLFYVLCIKFNLNLLNGFGDVSSCWTNTTHPYAFTLFAIKLPFSV